MTTLRITTACALLVLVVTVSAQEETLRAIAPPAGAPTTIGERLELRHRVKAAVIGVDTDDDAFLIPIAGSAPGVGGTFFRTDMAFHNSRSTAQTIAVGWMAQGVDNTHAGLVYYSLNGNTTTTADDFVGSFLGKSGLGAIIVFADDSNHNVDTAGQINGFSRIWTNQPGASGTVSQSFPAISLTDSIGSLVGSIIGLKQSGQYRTNIGVVNLDTVQHTWTVRASATGNTFTITVPPFSVVQAPLPPNNASSSGNVALTMQSDGFGFWWSAYGTSVDNLTGDGWVSRAIQ